MVVNLILIGLFLFFLYTFWYFISPTLSPIPFFPTNTKDIALISNILLDEDVHFSQLGTATPWRGGNPVEPQNATSSKKKGTIIDLGAGTGTVIFAAARKAFEKNLSTQFVAVEIHPLLIVILHLRRLLHPNRNNIRIIRADIFMTDLNAMLQDSKRKMQATIYLYVGIPALIRLKPTLEKLPSGSRVVSYMYEIPGWKRNIHKTHTGVMHALYEYIT